MTRVFVSLLVIIGLLVGKLAEVPHCHANIYADDIPHYELAPHFHLSWIRVAPNSEVADSPCIQTGAAESCGEPPTHDSDAIFLQTVKSTRFEPGEVWTALGATNYTSWLCQVNPRLCLGSPNRFRNTTLGVSTDLNLRLNVLRN